MVPIERGRNGSAEPTRSLATVSSNSEGRRSAEARLPRQGQVVTWRSVLLALVIMPAQAWWIVQMEVIRSNTWPSMLSLPLETLFIVLLLVAANALLRRRRPAWVLSQGELLTIYLMLAISGVIVGFGLLQQIISWVIAPVGRARPENQWDKLFWSYLPDWLVLKDKEELTSLFDGGSSFLTADHLREWAPVALSWSAFFVAFFTVIMSLNVLLRRRWIEEERLAFPLVQVPLAITEPAGRLFRSRLMWLGFGLAVSLGFLNGLHTLLPNMPGFQPDLSAANEVLGRRWSCFQQHGGTFWPPYLWAIGVSILMPLDVSFSYWFFFWLVKVEQLLTLVWGWDVAPDAPFVYQQAASALVAIGIYALWSARRHLLQVVSRAVRPGAEMGDSGEPLQYRWALGLLVVSVGFLSVFVSRAGAPAWLVPAYLGLYLSASLALSRIRAELGAPANEIHDAGPHQVLTQIVTPASFPIPALTVLTLLGWTSRSYGIDPTPFQMEGFKMAERTGLRTRGLVGATFVAVVAGLVFGYTALLVPLYHLGADSSKLQFNNSGVYAFAELQTWLTGVARAPGYRSLAMGWGLLFTFFLYAMRSRFLWWPFHPVGYVLAPMWFTHHLWLSVFIAWLTKLLLLRYGGMRRYVAALPFFLGLVLGDCVIGSIWALANLAFHIPTFSVWM